MRSTPGAPADRSERPAAYRDWKVVRVALEARTHPGERLGDAPHRPAAERPVAGEHGAEGVSGQEAQEQACGGAGVARNGVCGVAGGGFPAL